jgi:PBP1b-binding outer membrane lipoprotein LpoB
MQKKHILLLIIISFFLILGCSRQETDVKTPFFTSFHINQRLKDSNTITFDLKIYFDSKVQLDHALKHKDSFFHAVSITMQKYTLNDIKANKIKILLNDILNQVFRGHAVNFEITGLNQ